MEHKKISTLHKWFLKYFNRPAYKAYKESYRKAMERKNDALHLKKLEEDFIAATKQLPHRLPQAHTGPVRMKHSGNAGDTIYALPAMLALAAGNPLQISLHTNQPIDNKTLNHPLGNIMLNSRMVELLKPLLLHQPQIAAVTEYKGEAIDYDMDVFRNYNFYLDKGSIVHWYFWVHGVSYNTSLPWLTAPIDEQFHHTIVIARSQRYRSPLIDYGFLKKYDTLLFLGLEDEYREMKDVIPHLMYKPVADFLEMATIINSCQLFIGNQSFPFALAEALKVKRLLEVHYLAPNVVTEGQGANEFMYQPQFEYAVGRLLAS
ncbi:MAG TPA: hypothetical protein VGB71_19380 [Flavisolibacter sp.]|jgi:hypothetical protein